MEVSCASLQTLFVFRRSSCEFNDDKDEVVSGDEQYGESEVGVSAADEDEAADEAWFARSSESGALSVDAFSFLFAVSFEITVLSSDGKCSKLIMRSFINDTPFFDLFICLLWAPISFSSPWWSSSLLGLF